MTRIMKLFNLDRKRLQVKVAKLAGVSLMFPPDYPNDLNAVHDLEVSLELEELEEYQANLRYVQNETCDKTVESESPSLAHRFLFHVTAQQKCIAYILTKDE